MPYTIEFNSGGYHGHRLKDAFGGFTLGHLFDLEYIHTPHSYLDFFGIGYGDPVQSKWTRRLHFKKVKKITGPYWDGINDYAEMMDRFSQDLSDVPDDTLIVIERACRVFPFQTTPWYKKGLISKDIHSLVRDKVNESFNLLHGIGESEAMSKSDKPISVALHINRGTDFNKIKYPDHFESSKAVRYIFPLDYFDNIMNQIEEVFLGREVRFVIYTERLHSESIQERFQSRKNTEVRIGSNRRKKKNKLIHSIFMDFVMADILVTCNSGFSAMCSYFRKGKKTIYHPHRHLDYLPEPDCIKTDINGDFDAQLLLSR